VLAALRDLVLAIPSTFWTVGALGALFGVAELIATFRYASGRTFLSGWAVVPIAFNAAAGTVFFGLLTRVYPQAAASQAAAIAVGLGLPALIRTDLTLVRLLEAGGGERQLSLKPGLDL
jgi:uncharacterized membrane protein HdeD (DUF308 family)